MNPSDVALAVGDGVAAGRGLELRVAVGRTSGRGQRQEYDERQRQ